MIIRVIEHHLGAGFAIALAVLLNPIQAAIDLWNASGTRIYDRCALWTPTLVKLNIISDLLIWIAYLTIPLILLVFTRRRKDLPFPWMFWMFALFILGCGFTHFFEVYSIFWPRLWLVAGVKLFTAVVSLATIVALFPTMKLALLLRGPTELEALVRERTTELSEVNASLQVEIAEHQATQAALRTANDGLETRVRGRTAELVQANEELTGLAARLQRSNGELQEFATVASHDLQDPLRKIQAFGDRLQAKFADVLGEQGRDDLARMHSAASRMRRLIDDLLTFSRVTIKATPFAPVDLGQVAREVVSDLEDRIQQTGARVDLGELPIIDADPTQMRQLFQNLIGNALKFHRAELPPVVEVRAELLSPCPESTSTTCRIIVRDNGIGFDEKYLDRIFKVFERLHGRSEYEGTGMGLAICRKIVEWHGGTVTAHSAPGQGATFLVSMPVRHTIPENAI